MSTHNDRLSTDDVLGHEARRETLPGIMHPSTWSEHVAHWISQIGSPPVMVILAVILSGIAASLPGVWTWVALYLLLAILMPLGALVWMVRTGRVSDLDVQLREERMAPFIVTLIGSGSAWLVLLLGGAPAPLTLMAGTSVVQTVVIFLITLRWKISVHTSTAAGMTVLIWSVAGRAATPLVISVPLIAWSRVKLRRHTLAQAVAGTLLGSSVFLTAILVGG